LYRKYIKRLLDILFSLLLLIGLSPLYLLIAVLVRVKLGSPVFFGQRRPGLHEKVFTLHKFRSMTNETDEAGNLLPDIKRLTRFGLFLRKTSLDELPEIFNVLKGEMSFIGPRPLLTEYLPYYTEREKLRHTVRPGITGLAQVSGRNLLSWDARLEKDAEYVESLSFPLDLMILFKTFSVIFGHQEEVAADTSQAEGNLAKIRSARTPEEEHGAEYPDFKRGDAQ
jgi:lipopolysaccharide/colanic/teichoic acid biosynthesis glycosyltransferase